MYDVALGVVSIREGGELQDKYAVLSGQKVLQRGKVRLDSGIVDENGDPAGEEAKVAPADVVWEAGVDDKVTLSFDGTGRVIVDGSESPWALTDPASAQYRQLIDTRGHTVVLKFSNSGPGTRTGFVRVKHGAYGPGAVVFPRVD